MPAINQIETCVPIADTTGLTPKHETEQFRAIADTPDCLLPPFVEINEV